MGLPGGPKITGIKTPTRGLMKNIETRNPATPTSNLCRKRRAMATAIGKKANHLRNLCKRIRLYSHFGPLGQCRSIATPPTIIHALQYRTLPLISPALPFGLGIPSLSTNQRYSLNTTVTTVESENPVPKNDVKLDSEKPVPKSDVKSDSEGAEKSGDSNQEKSDGGKPVRGGPVSWLSFLLLILTGAGLIWYYDREKKRHIEEISSSSEAVKQGPSAGKAAIGGPFNLINHDGKNVTDKDFLGNWTMIYFGFTHCPDICPDELQKLAAAVDKIKDKGRIDVLPVFISVDPERDTVEQVCEYVKEFHPKLVGLTGSPEEIKKVARAYRVYYMKTVEEDSDYLVDHSIVMYLMSPKMEFVKFFGKNNDVDSLADGVIKEIKQHKK
ncbi:protein SCO1 homolog 1, mitochondrial-like isoform X2 [Mangifera indica]|uniref:protein SCO1 homolog 1, mitochondrial-like isoform X2 n=1 Tax=Mangifera indica TaxID=29780 RepID=UPI001CF9B068|nr:protein SCO1 homolog 1, mitochondrial-like isoform X2 [Mangifera indica]